MRICYDHHIFSSQDLGGVGTEFDLRDPFLLVSQHPVTTEYGNDRWQIEQTLDALSRLRMHTIMLWPNADAGRDDFEDWLIVERFLRGG